MADFGVTEALAIGSLVAGGAGTAINMVGQSNQAKAAADQANYQAAVARNNSTIASYNARAAAAAGQAEAQAQGLRERAQLGAIRAAEGAAGLDINDGSNVDLRVSQRQAGVQDVGAVEHNAQLKAYGYQTQAANYDAQSGLYDTQAKSATAALPLQLGSTALSGLSSLGDKWSKFQTAGIVGGGSSSSGNAVSTAYGGVASYPANSNAY